MPLLGNQEGWMLNDPERNMEQTVGLLFRNMRSKGRCSHVLQFTFRRAVSCVLHRPTSQVIHCKPLFLTVTALKAPLSENTVQKVFHIPSRGELVQTQKSGEGSYAVQYIPWHKSLGHCT